MWRSYFKRRLNLINRRYIWLLLPAWVIISFYTAHLIVFIPLFCLKALGVQFNVVNEVLVNAIIAVLVYLVTLSIAILLPRLIKRRYVSKAALGLGDLPTWTDIILAPAGFIVYMIISSVLLMLVINAVPGFNANQPQDVGFDRLVNSFELLLGFVTLVIVAPIAEEVLFRGFLYGKLRQYHPILISATVTSVLFGLIHGAWNVAIDTFALSIVLCALREMTGRIWAPILLHMVKNAIAFYILFISPSLLTTLVR